MNQSVSYYLLSLLISWTIWFPLYAPALGIHDLPVVPFHHAIGGLGPLLASVICTFYFDGKPGLKALAAKMFSAGNRVMFVVALFSPFVLLLIAVFADSAVRDVTVNLSALLPVKEFPHFSLPVFFLYNLVFFGFGEETGWRGFLLPRLQQNRSALVSAVILSVLWAAWHIPLFFYRSGYTEMGIAGIAGWFFSLLTGSILLSWMYNSSRGSILVCAIFHSTIDVAFTANVPHADVVNYLGMFVTIWGLLTIAIFKPANLSLHGKVTLQTQ
jgi:membrane protease YdiL (CAAX protease family)